MKQKGFTVIEVFFCLIALSVVAGLGLLLFVGGHFLVKFW